MKRQEILQHYKLFFNMEGLPMAEGDQLIIDWAEDLMKKQKDSVQELLNKVPAEISHLGKCYCFKSSKEIDAFGDKYIYKVGYYHTSTDAKFFTSYKPAIEYGELTIEKALTKLLKYIEDNKVNE